MPVVDYSEAIKKHLWYPLFFKNTIEDNVSFCSIKSVEERLTHKGRMIINKAFKWASSVEKEEFWFNIYQDVITF